jgi:hypothetical protein
MAVAVLFDKWQDRACLYCTTSGQAFGPVFHWDAEAKAEAFLEWFESGRILDNQTAFDVLAGMSGDGSDPRAFNAAELERLYALWQDEALDGNDNLMAAA